MQGKPRPKPATGAGKSRPTPAPQEPKLLVKKVTTDPIPVVFATPLQQREEEIARLKDSVSELEAQLRHVGQAFGEGDGIRAALEARVRALESTNSMLDLENAQLRMKLESSETKLGKELTKVSLMGEQTTQNLGKVDALSRENVFLRERMLEKEALADRFESDLKVCSQRLDKANRQLVEMQEQMNKKQNDVATLEKALARKNEHLEILLRKDKEISSVLKKKREEVLEDRLLAQVEELDGKETPKEREWKEQAVSAQAQTEVYKKKLKRAEDERMALEKEAKKLREDNFYLTTRLKTLKKP